MQKQPTDLDQLSSYLKQYIVEQDPSLYTPIDHASWRYIMRVSKAFFKDRAHPKYIDGLRETGISTERIPLIEEMDECLKRFGWRAVAVSGFIPPAVFIEFEALGVLPIACDMRTLEHIHYTPAPDIVHEAAGHAPLIADSEFGAFLRTYGETARKAIYSSEDEAVYEAVRNLSIIKEEPGATPDDIANAQKQLDEALAAVSWVSEATQLGRIFWWTTEYGLIGDLKNPLIYGAGLLSSVGESYGVYNSDVKWVPFSVECSDVNFDITKPQPQLFVVSDFPALIKEVNQFAKSMAFMRGGTEGLKKALRARTVTTAVLETELQISGKLVRVWDEGQLPFYLKFEGPCQLAVGHRELEGHGADYHREGFGTPIGRIKDLGKTAAEISESELKAQGFESGKKGRLEFESGVVVEGVLKDRVRLGDQNLVLAFEDCRVFRGDEVFFEPDWGTFDMACGEKVVSVFGGAAQRSKYFEKTGGLQQKPQFPKTNLTNGNRQLAEYYGEVRRIREGLGNSEAGPTAKERLKEIHEILNRDFPDDWLLRMELFELVTEYKLSKPHAQLLKKQLETLDQNKKAAEGLIPRGLALIN